MVQGEAREAPFFTAIMTFLTFTFMILLGRMRDLLDSISGSKRAPKGYAALREKQEDFYQRRMFGRIRDCWNRPIASAPDAWLELLERVDPSHTSNAAELKLLGTTRRCLNLGSYNYLGFAAADAYCTPIVHSKLDELCVSTCSPRVDAGTTPLHLQLEEMVAEFVGKEAAVTFGMGYATNSACIPALVGKGCLIISDQLNHASIVSGSRTSGAKLPVVLAQTVSAASEPSWPVWSQLPAASATMGKGGLWLGTGGAWHASRADWQAQQGKARRGGGGYSSKAAMQAMAECARCSDDKASCKEGRVSSFTADDLLWNVAAVAAHQMRVGHVLGTCPDTKRRKCTLGCCAPEMLKCVEGSA